MLVQGVWCCWVKTRALAANGWRLETDITYLIDNKNLKFDLFSKS